MLPKHYRLRRTRDFARARRFGRSAGTSLLALYIVPTRDPELRVGFSVSKRVGKAVVRNRVKRLMREAMRRHVSMLAPGQDLVVIARPAAAAATRTEVCDSIAYAIRKAGARLSPSRGADNA